MTSPEQPPDLDALAALDAGTLDPDRAAQVRSAAAADPRALDVLAALAAVRAELAGLRDPAPPAAVLDRWSAALAALPAPTGPTGPAQPDAPGPPALAVPDPAARRGLPGTPEPVRPPHTGPLGPATPYPGGPASTAAPQTGTGATRGRARPGHPAAGPPGPDRPDPGPRPPTRPWVRPGRGGDRRLRIWLGAVAAAAVAGGVLLTGPGPQQPTGPPTTDVLTLRRADLGAAASAVLGPAALGPLADAARRDACLLSAGGPVGAPVLGGRPVRLDGVDGVLLVLGTGELGRVRVVVVDRACTALLADTTAAG